MAFFTPFITRQECKKKILVTINNCKESIAVIFRGRLDKFARKLNSIISSHAFPMSEMAYLHDRVLADICFISFLFFSCCISSLLWRYFNFRISLIDFSPFPPLSLSLSLHLSPYPTSSHGLLSSLLLPVHHLGLTGEHLEGRIHQKSSKHQENSAKLLDCNQTCGRRAGKNKSSKETATRGETC